MIGPAMWLCDEGLPGCLGRLLSVIKVIAFRAKKPRPLVAHGRGVRRT